MNASAGRVQAFTLPYLKRRIIMIINMDGDVMIAPEDSDLPVAGVTRLLIFQLHIGLVCQVSTENKMTPHISGQPFKNQSPVLSAQNPT